MPECNVCTLIDQRSKTRRNLIVTLLWDVNKTFYFVKLCD